MMKKQYCLLNITHADIFCPVRYITFMKEKLNITSHAESREDEGKDIEAAGMGVIDSFAKENETLTQIIPEQFEERLNMAREENSRIGTILKRFQGKTAHMVGMTMLGLSLSWGMPHGAEAASPQQKVEMQDNRYEAAQQALQESGLKLPLPREGILSQDKDMRHLQALIETEKILASRLQTELLELAVHIGRAERNNTPASLPFKLAAKNVEEYLNKAEKVNHAATAFSVEPSPYGHIYGRARKVLAGAKQMLADAEHPSERQKELWKTQEVIDRLEEKSKKEKWGLEYKEQKLLEELRVKVKQLKEKPQEPASSVSPRQEKQAPVLPEHPPSDETPAEVMRREAEKLRQSRERIEKLAPILQEEMRRLLQRQDK